MLDYSTFTNNLSISKIIIIIIYIDNFLYLELDIIEMNIIKSFLDNHYKIKDLSLYEEFIKTRLKQNLEKKTIFLS